MERQDITAEGLRGARISWKVLAEYAPRTRVILHNSWANQCTQMPIDIPSTHDHRGGGGSGDSKKRERGEQKAKAVEPGSLRDSRFILFSIMIVATIVADDDDDDDDRSGSD